MKIEINVSNNGCEIFVNKTAVDFNNSNIDYPVENIIVNLYIARKEKKLKQSDVARLLNMHSVTYSRKENGESEFTLSEAFILADFFETTVDVLFADKKPLIK